MTTIERKIIAGPDVKYQGRTVYVENVALGEFDNPWKVAVAIQRGYDVFAKRLRAELDEIVPVEPK